MPFKRTNEQRRQYFKLYLNNHFKLFLNLNKDGEIKTRINSFVKYPFKKYLKKLNKDGGWNLLVTQQEYNCFCNYEQTTTEEEKNPFNQKKKIEQTFLEKLKKTFWGGAPIIKGLSPPPSYNRCKGPSYIRTSGPLLLDKNNEYTYTIYYEGKQFLRWDDGRTYDLEYKKVGNTFKYSSFAYDGGLMPVELIKKNNIYWFRVPSPCIQIMDVRTKYNKTFKAMYSTLITPTQSSYSKILVTRGQKRIIRGMLRWEKYKIDEESAKKNKIINLLNKYKISDKHFSQAAGGV
jgi:hypothetical protein